MNDPCEEPILNVLEVKLLAALEGQASAVIRRCRKELLERLREKINDGSSEVVVSRLNEQGDEQGVLPAAEASRRVGSVGLRSAHV